MNDELPEGWARAPLGEVAGVNPRHPRDLDEDLIVTFVPMPAVSESGWKLAATRERPWHEVRTGYTHFAEGDVLFAKITPCMENGKAAVATNLRNGLGCGTTELHVLRPYTGIDAKYLYHFIHQESFRREAANNFTGTAGQLRVPVDFVRNVEVPLAPVEEQRRIVAKMEALLARVKASQERLGKVPRILRRFRHAVVAAACSGKLTADWRAKNPQNEDMSTFLARRLSVKEAQILAEGFTEIPPSWAWVRFESITDSIRGGSTVPPHNSPTHYPVLRSSSVREGTVDLEDVKFLDAEDSKNPDNFLRDGDLLFTRLSGSLEYVANCAIVEDLNGRRVQYPDRLFCGKLKMPAMNHYVSLCFRHPGLRAELTERAKSSAGHQRVSISDITKQKIPLPPLKEQQEITRRVHALFALADDIETRVKNTQAHVNNLTQSVLAKAFRAELVPTEAELARREGRTYETAQELLARTKKTQSPVSGNGRLKPRRRSAESHA